MSNAGSANALALIGSPLPRYPASTSVSTRESRPSLVREGTACETKIGQAPMTRPETGNAKRLGDSASQAQVVGRGRQGDR